MRTPPPIPQKDSPPAKPPERSRLRAIVGHVFWSAVLIPAPVKSVLFVIISNVNPRPIPGALVWFAAGIGAFVFATRLSLRRLMRFHIPESERCIMPSVIGFAPLLMFSLLIDIAVASNSGIRKPGGIVLLSLVIHFGLFTWMSLRTQAVLGSTTNPDAPAKFRVTSLLVPLGDILAVVALIVFIILLNS